MAYALILISEEQRYLFNDFLGRLTPEARTWWNGYVCICLVRDDTEC
jgi:hypothetical protein